MNWRLIFSGIQSPLWTICVLLGVLLAVGLFVGLRRYEAKLVSPAVGRTLMTLRILVLLVLLATMLQPVLTRTWESDQQRRLVIAFDVSESMDTADRHAAPAEMLRWAQALNMLGNADTASQLEEWIRAYESNQQPDWGNGDAQLADLRQRHLQGVFDELGRMPRTEFVRRLLMAQPNDLLQQLKQVLQTEVVVFGSDPMQVEAEQLSDLLQSDRAEVEPTDTDAIKALTESLGDDQAAQVQALVLFSDGRQTVRSDAAAEAARLGRLGIPVHTIPIGSALSPRDLSIASVQVPQSVFLEDNAVVQASLASGGFAGEAITVDLLKDGQPIDQQSIVVSGDSFDVEFEIPTDEAGNHSYEISTPVQPGELRDDNNSRTFAVAVVDNKARVLLVEGDARWEFRFLKAALERDPRVELSTVLFQQPYLKLLNRTFLDSALPAEGDLRQRLAETDLLIVGDVQPSRLPEAFWQQVDEAVSVDGLTLLVLPGRNHMPHGFQSPTLDRLLPVTEPSAQVAERLQATLPDAPPTVFQLTPTPEAAGLTLFDFAGAEAGSGTTLADLPGHPWVYFGRPKPVATVWATAEVDGVRLANDRSAAVVHQYYGFGQVVWMGVDSTWRWRRRAGDRWHHRFWGQLVRWAAQNKASAGNNQVRLSLSDLIVQQDQPVEVDVRWDADVARQLQDASVSVVVEAIATENESDSNTGANATGDSERQTNAPPSAPVSAAQTVQLQRDDQSPERFRGQMSGLSPGSYRVSLQLQDSPIRLDTPVEADIVVQRKRSVELANVSCNRDFLQQLAVLSGGEFLEPWQLADLPELVQPQIERSSLLQERTLWDHWLLLVLFFILLSAEWILRKMNGLP